MAAITVALFAAETAINLYGAERQTEMAEEAESFKEQQIRAAQINARLQDTEKTLARDDQLRRIIASTVVQESVRNISGASGSVRAVLQHDFNNFDQDSEAQNLNLQYRLSNLDIERAASKLNEESQIDNAWLGAAKNIISSAFSATLPYSQGPKMGATGSSASSVSASSSVQIPDPSDLSQVEAPYTDYGYGQRNPFDINEGA
jgi:hypothetical protein